MRVDPGHVGLCRRASRRGSSEGVFLRVEAAAMTLVPPPFFTATTTPPPLLVASAATVQLLNTP